jgi:hypothetical protein
MGTIFLPIELGLTVFGDMRQIIRVAFAALPKI